MNEFVNGFLRCGQVTGDVYAEMHLDAPGQGTRERTRSEFRTHGEVEYRLGIFLDDFGPVLLTGYLR